MVQLITEGSSKLASVPAAGGAVAAGGAAAAAAGGAAEAPKEEEKEEGAYTCPKAIAVSIPLTRKQRRRSPTRTWALVSSTKLPIAWQPPSGVWAGPEKLNGLCARSRWRLHRKCLGRVFGIMGFAGNCQ